MEQHPVPQNIATFEFKLFGNLTVRQFITLLIPMTLAAVIFFSNALSPVLRTMIAGIIGLLGFIIAVIPFNGRPFDKWAVSFVKAILSPTTRIWIKEQKIPEFLTIVVSPPPKDTGAATVTTTQSREKLLAYLKSLPNAKQSPLDIREQVAVEKLALDNISPSQGRLPPTITWGTHEAETEIEQPLEVLSSLPPAPQILEHAQNKRRPIFINKNQNIPAFIPKEPSPAQKTTPTVAASTSPLPQVSKPKPRIVKIASYAKPYILPGLEQKLSETYFKHIKTKRPTPKAHLAAETNFTMQNIIPIQIAQNELRLIPSVGQIRVRKLHFAPPPNFDLSKLPVRGEKTFDVSEELKKRFEDKEESLINAFSEQVPQPIIRPAPIPKIAPGLLQKTSPVSSKNIQFIPKPNSAYTQKPNVKQKDVPNTQAATQVSFHGKKVKGPQAQVLTHPQTVALTTKPNILSGIITAANGNPLEAAVIVVRDQNGIPQRALKSNKLGQFISATPLANGTYTIEVEAQNAHFSPKSITLDGHILPSVEIQGES